MYRTIELSEGYTGHLATTEWYFYVFDTVRPFITSSTLVEIPSISLRFTNSTLPLNQLPLWLGICAYIPFWPPKYMTESTRVIAAEKQEGTGMSPVGESAGTSVGEDVVLEQKV